MMPYHFKPNIEVRIIPFSPSFDSVIFLSNFNYYTKTGARFYDAIDEANARNDLIEADLAKDIESTRLFRCVHKRIF